MPRASREKARCPCQGRYGSSMAKVTLATGTVEPLSRKLTDAAPRRARSRVVRTVAAPGAHGFLAVASSMTISEALEQSAATSAATAV